eukprot:c17125_g1_i1.p1 GENE.c17125_g1_i1~~c17125_g1_i1.p1  ORF type:complete len:230 (+),score=42.04 c17125_g1_i1:59-748(+)
MSSLGPFVDRSPRLTRDLAAPTNTSAKPAQWWRFFTPIFMHVGVIHLGLNIAAQLFVGVDVESVIGPIKMSLAYLLCGVGGNILSSFLDPSSVTVGASGSLYGIVGMQVIDIAQTWRILEKRFDTALRMALVVILLLVAGTLPWIDNFAHVGGFLTGLVCGLAFLPFFFFSAEDERRKRWITLFSRVFILVGYLIIFVLFYTLPEKTCSWCKYISCIPYTSNLCKSSTT